MSPRKHIPVRMCIGCGSRRAKGELVRLNRQGKQPPSGDTRGIAGKGFYLCPDPACLVVARRRMKRKGFLEVLNFAVLESLRVRDKEKQEEAE